MEYEHIVTDTRKYLREIYAPFINGSSIDRLVLTDRKDLLSALHNVTSGQLEEAINRMKSDGHIQEDTGILITFKASFILTA